jgi:predicted component of type VI protein secretion system
MRFEISEGGGEPLPPLDIVDDVVVIGSGPDARVRLPADAAHAAHIRIEGQGWTLLAESRIGGMVRAAGDSGSVGHGMVIELGNYRVRVSATPVGTPASLPGRTDSLARELMRGLLGDEAAPALEIERGMQVGSRRELAPPESTLVIGRGDEAHWVILDEDLSLAHAEIRRSWDGVTVVDLGSKNGTRVDGAKLGGRPVELHDGQAVALGNLVMRFHDPAERHLRGDAPAAPPDLSPAVPPAHAPHRAAFFVFAAVTVAALAALLWILSM